MLQIGSTVDGYLVLEELGRGGMGVVYRAHQMSPDRVVVLKAPLHGRRTPQETRCRFLEECQTLAKVESHHNIVTVHEVTQDNDGDPFMVMEFVKGESLQERLDAAPSRRLPLSEIVDIVLGTLDALDHIHNANVLHRDIKPSNIMITRKNGRDIPKLIDFGIAKDMAPARSLWHTATGNQLGTALFMSPEQAHSPRAVDPRTDIYAVGMVLYVALSGCLPYDLDTTDDWLAALKRGAPMVPLDRRVATLPRGIADIVHRAIALDRAERFASAREFRDALRACASTMVEAPSATPRGGAAISRRVAENRHSDIRRVGGAVIAAAIVGLALWFYRGAHEAEIPVAIETASARAATPDRPARSPRDAPSAAAVLAVPSLDRVAEARSVPPEQATIDRQDPSSGDPVMHLAPVARARGVSAETIERTSTVPSAAPRANTEHASTEHPRARTVALASTATQADRNASRRNPAENAPADAAARDALPTTVFFGTVTTQRTDASPAIGQEPPRSWLGAVESGGMLRPRRRISEQANGVTPPDAGRFP